MPNEKSPEPKEEQTKELSAKAALGRKPAIALYLGVFLAATAWFAWMDGLLGPSPHPPAATADRMMNSTAPALTQATARPAAAFPSQPAPNKAEPSQDGLETRLAEEHRELDRKRKELEELKSEVERLLARVQETKSERVAMMAKLYDNMDPEAAARQISGLDDHSVVLLLPQMNTRTAARVMAAIDPPRAARITTKMLALEP